ncbi:MAG: hypothetical protein ABL955_16140, partial [Elusimicrobiota bacterium]
MKPLNPIMAVLVIASVGASPLRTLAADGKVTVPAAVGVAVPVRPEDKDSITRLTEVLNNKSAYPTAVADAGQRIADFLLNPDGKKSFVASDVDRVALNGVALDWAKKAKPGDLAMLYFVVGTGAKAPKWVSDDKLLAKTVLPQREAEGRLRIKLDRYADAAGAQIKHSGDESPEAIQFLKEAAKEAKYIFDHPATKVSTDGSIGGNDVTAVKPPDTTRPAGSQFDGAAQQYTLEDLYIKGAKVIDVSGPDDKNSRKISMKIYSKRLEDGSVVNEIGIYDITDSPKDIFGRRFPMDGDKSFVLDDRTPGHKNYELKFSNGEKG